MKGIPKNRGAVNPVSYSFPTHVTATIIVHVSSIKQSSNKKKHDIETVAEQIGCVREGVGKYKDREIQQDGDDAETNLSRGAGE